MDSLKAEIKNGRPESAVSKPEYGKQELILPGYRFVKELGRGTQGKILLAERESDGLSVAIKQLNISSVKNWKSYELFHREADVLKSLNIDGVAKFYDAIERLDDIPPCSYIVQEYIPGKSLQSMIKAGHRLSVHRIYRIILQLLNILKSLQEHDPPVIHRDIKPSNILLVPQVGDEFKVYLIDFGAVANPQVQGGGSTVAGTYGFMPPEQMMGNPQPSSDIYALAAVAVNLITGISPADMPVKDFHLIFEPEVQNMPVQVVSTLRRMLEPSVDNRLCNIDELIGIFENFSMDAYQIEQGVVPINETEYNNKLLKVRALGQNGNVELWQRLPDHTPRELPKPYQEIRLNKSWRDLPGPNRCFHYVSNISAYEHTSIMGVIDESAAGNNFLKTLMFIVFGFLFALLGFSLSVVLGSIIAILLVLGGIACIFFGVGALLTFSIQKAGGFLVDIFGSDNKENYEVFKNGQVGYFDYSALLKGGRKTIATVVDIQYCPADPRYLEIGYNIFTGSDDDKNGMIRNKGCSIVNHGVPSFKITYRFNPPDDSNPDDLVHQITVHDDPDEWIKPGDPLPILYRIFHHDNKEYVSSMPYPFPLDSLVDVQDFWYKGC